MAGGNARFALLRQEGDSSRMRVPYVVDQISLIWKSSPLWISWTLSGFLTNASEVLGVFHQLFRLP